jgi:hypothetical protein
LQFNLKKGDNNVAIIAIFTTTKRKTKKKAMMMARRKLNFKTPALGPTFGALEFLGPLQARCSHCNFKRAAFAFIPTPMALAME